MTADKYKKLSIVIPVYNEENTLQELLGSVFNADASGLEKEIIIVDDGSNKQTKKIIKQFQNKKRIKVIENELNHGKGYSVRQGFKQTTGDIVLIQDADLEYSPEEYPDLLEPLLENKADVVIGTRFVTQKAHRTLYFHHYLVNKLLTFISNVFTNLNLSDMECGFKVFKGEFIRTIADELQSDSFTIEPELIAKVSQYKQRVYEVGISYQGRTYQEGKKITWQDGFKALWSIIKYNLM
jgi:glycosyltransferase involved in cell wall biosynthesis